MSKRPRKPDAEHVVLMEAPGHWGSRCEHCAKTLLIELPAALDVIFAASGEFGDIHCHGPKAAEGGAG